MNIWLAIFIGLSALFVLNLAGSAWCAVVWYAMGQRAERWSARHRANLIFALRCFPVIGSLIFVTVFLLPAYFLFEPENAKEAISLKLAAPAIASLILMLFAAWRFFGKLWKTRRIVAGWLADAETIKVPGIEIPIYQIRHPFPLIAVVGVFSPKMFVAQRIFESLDENEFRAAVAHECGHLIERDNLKRILLGVCRDLNVLPFNRQIDARWSETAESAADEYAVRTGDASTAVDLAAAIVKIARFAPLHSRPTQLVGASMLTEQTSDVAWRVRRLLSLSEIKIFPAGFSLSGLLPPLFFFAFLLLILAAIDLRLWEKIHGFIEIAVHLFQ